MTNFKMVITIVYKDVTKGNFETKGNFTEVGDKEKASLLNISWTRRSLPLKKT